MIYIRLCGWLAGWMAVGPGVPVLTHTHTEPILVQAVLFTLWACVSSAALWVYEVLWHRVWAKVCLLQFECTQISYLRFIRRFLFESSCVAQCRVLMLQRQIYAHTDRIWGIQQHSYSIYLQSRTVFHLHINYSTTQSANSCDFFLSRIAFSAVPLIRPQLYLFVLWTAFQQTIPHKIENKMLKMWNGFLYGKKGAALARK